MFLIAGIQPKTKNLDQHARLCPQCGLARAWQKRVDHYFSLFFIPLVRVKKGEPFLACDRCEMVTDDGIRPDTFSPDRGEHRCAKCGRNIRDEFTYCPHCGQRIR